MPIQGGLPEEAVVCPQCDGKGWRSVNFKPYLGRPVRRPEIKVIRRSLGVCPPADAARTGNLMTCEDFDKFFPAAPASH